jgi:hypothetical protein
VRVSSADLRDVLNAYPELALKPVRDARSALEGELRFSAERDGLPRLTTSFRVRIEFADDPTSLPITTELEGRIPRTPDHHVNPDGSLCLGSPFRLRLALARDATLLAYIDRCLVPFLYAAEIREAQSGALVFGELAHGSAGLLSELEQAFGLRGKGPVLAVLSLLALRRRVANKRPCPCGCDRRLGSCRLHQRLVPIRRAVHRAAIRATIAELTRMI